MIKLWIKHKIYELCVENVLDGVISGFKSIPDGDLKIGKRFSNIIMNDDDDSYYIFYNCIITKTYPLHYNNNNNNIIAEFEYQQYIYNERSGSKLNPNEGVFIIDKNDIVKYIK